MVEEFDGLVDDIKFHFVHKWLEQLTNVLGGCMSIAYSGCILIVNLNIYLN